jgi:hypothetical protein
MSELSVRVRRMSGRTKNRIFGAWFALDAILAMLPPVYWAVNGIDGTVLGLPFSVAYFIFTALVITASVVAIYVVEDIRGEVD